MKAAILVAGLLAASAGMANAAAICSGTATASSTVTAATDGSTFVKSSFQIKCSANTLVDTLDNGAQVAVCSVSKKGKTKFGGSSEGGAVESKGACTKNADNTCKGDAAKVDTGC